MIYSQPMLAPSPFEIDPIDEAVQWLDDLGLAPLLFLAKTGVHIHNPYHNLTHELLVVYHALNAFHHATSVVGGTYNDLAQSARELTVAALFHDHDHSGGKHKDYDNIQRAIIRVASFPDTVDYEKMVSVAMISKTEFTDGKFPNEPKTFREECLRDADLCSIYTTRGQLILMELPREFGGKAVYRMGKEERAQFFIKNKAFLQSCEMFTDYGKMMKEFHLDRACEDFEDLVSRATMANHTPSYSNWNAV